MRHVLAAAIAFLLLSGAASAQEFRAGVHYQVLDQPLSTTTGDRIEIREFFSYGCPHCYRFYPLVQDLERGLGDDVELTHTPIIFNDAWVPLARAYLTAEALDVVDQVHRAIFTAYHEERRRLSSEDAFAEVFTAQGVDEQAFRDAWNSFGVDTTMRRAVKVARDYRISSTPSMAVNGKYVIDTRMAGSQASMVRIVEHLVELERQAVR